MKYSARFPGDEPVLLSFPEEKEPPLKEGFCCRINFVFGMGWRRIYTHARVPAVRTRILQPEEVAISYERIVLPFTRPPFFSPPFHPPPPRYFVQSPRDWKAISSKPTPLPFPLACYPPPRAPSPYRPHLWQGEKTVPAIRLMYCTHTSRQIQISRRESRIGDKGAVRPRWLNSCPPPRTCWRGMIDSGAGCVRQAISHTTPRLQTTIASQLILYIRQRRRRRCCCVTGSYYLSLLR